jgi:hypothetical protein
VCLRTALITVIPTVYDIAVINVYDINKFVSDETVVFSPFTFWQSLDKVDLRPKEVVFAIHRLHKLKHHLIFIGVTINEKEEQRRRFTT